MTPTPDPAAAPAQLSPADDLARAIAERDQAAAEHRELRREDAVTRLASAAGADPDRLRDSQAFAAEFADLPRDASDTDVAAAIDRTLTAQPSLRTTPLVARRPPRAAGAQGSSSTTTTTEAQRRANAAANPTPAGRIANEIRRANNTRRTRP